jgi:GTP cyclohydrolase II
MSRPVEAAGVVPKLKDVVEIPLNHGGSKVRFHTFDNLDREHLLILFGERQAYSPLVRIHSECLTGDVFGSLRCDAVTNLRHPWNGCLAKVDTCGRRSDTS